MPIIMAPNFKVLANQTEAVEADNTAVAAKIYCSGARTTYTAPQVGVGSNNTLTFYKAGASADTGIGASGVMDGTAAAYDTFGEIAALVAANDNWHMHLVGALSADDPDGTIVDITATAAAGLAAGSEDGAVLYWLTTGALRVTACIGLEALDSTAGRFLSRRSDATVFDTVRDTADLSDADPLSRVHQPRDLCNFITSIYVTNTTSHDSDGTVTVYAAKQDGSQRTLRSLTPNHTDATPTTFDFSEYPIFADPGERLVVVYKSSVLTGPKMVVEGGRGVWIR